MSTQRFIRAGLAACLALGLAACGNDNAAEGQALAALKGLFRKEEQPTRITTQQIAAALQGSTAPLVLVEFEDRDGVQGILSEIEVNGAHHTFGNQARNVIVLRDGMITATRGFGGDLMSVEEDALLALVKSRSPGTATYVQRFLMPEATTTEFSYRCATRPLGSQQVALGLVNEMATTVQVDCYGTDPETTAQVGFTNTYAVGPSGTILSGRQWLGDTLGMVVSHYLRR